jgi:ABC-type nitrate/sulfonate/bicarbonate transport system ATPase subunit
VSTPGAATPRVSPLRTQALGRHYGRLVALESLSLTVEAGECVALIGANGSGKSTAVPLIGEVLVRGRRSSVPARRPDGRACGDALSAPFDERRR